METTLYFLRHAETHIDPSRPVSMWELSQRGYEHAKEVSESGIFDDVDTIISSGEPKAFTTAKFVGDRLAKDVIQNHLLNEINRDSCGLLTEEDYVNTMKVALQNMDKSKHGWETAYGALRRYGGAIEKIESEYNNKSVLVVSHGTVMTLYFCKLLDKLDQAYERERKLGYCAYGVVKNGKLIKDII